MESHHIIVLAVLGLASFVLAVALVEPRRFRVRHRRLHCDGSGCTHKLSVLHVTDFHFRPGERAKLQFVARLGELDVDLVVVTGDMIDENDGIPMCLEATAALRPRLGTYAVLGGHDYYRTGVKDLVREFLRGVHTRHEEVDTDRLVSGLEAQGIVVLVNRRAELEHEGMKVDIVGIDDIRHGSPDVDAAFAGRRPDALTLALAHEPSLVDEIAAHGPDVAFAGHTHGGQIRIPGIGALVTRSKLHPRHASGVFRVGRTTFHLNNGVGTGRFTPFRMFCRPEASVVDILPEGAADAEA